MQNSLHVKRQLLALSKPSSTLCRTVTDVPWHKVGDETHLHVMDGRSTRRKFEIKLDKLEKKQIALERRRQFPKAQIKLSSLEPIEVPRFIERGPSDILR